jgi:hypothetical protein
MNTQNKMEERLWDYIDGVPDKTERSSIEQLIQTNQEWKLKYAELLEIHQLMHAHIDLEEPSMRFRQNVMEAIAREHIAPATKSYINKKIIWGVGGFFVTMLVGLIVYSFAQVNWSNTSGESTIINIDKFDWSRFLNNTYTNIFLMVNIVLGLMLLDMYLTNKKKKITV